jgi:hypothetical protein
MKFSPIAEKYAKIDLEGRKALKKEDSVNKFEGFSENLKNRFGTVMIFNEESKKLLKESLIDKIESISKETEIDFALAGRDFPIHSTLLEGLCDDEKTSKAVFEKIKGNIELIEVINSLNNLEVEFKYLLIDKGNILLTCINIPKEILIARGAINKILEENGLKPLQLNNILHISIARMTNFPAIEQGQKFNEYKEKVVKLRHEISSNPIKLKISEVLAGSSFDFLTSQ